MNGLELFLYTVVIVVLGGFIGWELFKTKIKFGGYLFVDKKSKLSYAEFVSEDVFNEEYIVLQVEELSINDDKEV